MITPGYLPFHPNPKTPREDLPPLTCDSHCHVFGPGDIFPYSKNSTYIPIDASRTELLRRHRHLGIERAVIVQASCHGTDNSAMIDALKSGGNQYRGIAVVEEDVELQALSDMNEVGVRGVRFNFVKRLGGGMQLKVYETILAKIQPLKWHVVVYFDPEDLEELTSFLKSIPTPVVIDHMGRVPASGGIDHPAFKLLHRLLEENEKFWVKVSCPERISSLGPPYSDVDPIAKKLIADFPKRVLWGTDWPHPNMKSHMPDDGELVDRILTICDTAHLRQQVLVENPARLYW